MFILHQIRIPCGTAETIEEREAQLRRKARQNLRLQPSEPLELVILRHSIDARKKPLLFDVYSVGVTLSRPKEQERRLAARLHNRNVVTADPAVYHFPGPAADGRGERPVVIGFGPAGIFCSLLLARAGYRPIVLERGRAMEARVSAVDRLWSAGILDPAANCQFGEGGAGTFSDGKLNTNATDHAGRTDFVLRTFVEAGAPEDILYEAHPHIGTDRLRQVIVNLREEICSLGGEVRFESQVRDLITADGRLRALVVESPAGSYTLPADRAVLSTGHSARDTLRMLQRRKVPMEAKAFAVGLRVSHPQRLIDERTYGNGERERLRKLHLPAANYKLTARAADGHGVYSFCMCPGGYIVNASSEPGRLAVNGMSNYARDSGRANSAVVVTVSPEDYTGSPDPADPLAGLRFQETLEEQAYALADGRVPVERYADFEAGRDPGNDPALSDAEALCIKGMCAAAPVHTLLPSWLRRDFIEGMQDFEHKIPGFTGPEALVAGIESRTSSPVRILRDDGLQSAAVRGLYPCGEGAGYAGGITSAAMDGIRVAEAVARDMGNE